jgi:hypothetical protein
MPFLLYNLEGERRHLKYCRQVQLAGKLGPIAELAREKAPRGGGWHAPEKQFLVAAAARPGDHALIVDLKPRDKQAVHLYRFRNVWGFSYGVWTPLLFQLEELHPATHSKAGPARLKECFPLPEGPREIVHEFCYVNGGHRGGTWKWGMIGHVNGAVLRSDALEYFLGALSRRRDAPSQEEVVGALSSAPEGANEVGALRSSGGCR